MKRTIYSFFIFMLCASSLFAQKKDVLLTIDDDPIYANEFKRVFKKNLDLVQDDSQKSVDGYLELFIDYKLKIAEAYAQGLDKKKEYKKEFSKYEEQLARNYIFEDKVTEDLAKEAYERGLEEIKAAHILILTTFDDPPQDTLAAYNKISKIREDLIKNGGDFEAKAKKTSEEPNADKSGGNLGYFTVFSLVYPFETAAYATPVGEISEITRTQYGYHIIKVLDRREREPEISVSHIMITDKKGDTRTFNPEERINEVYGLLQQGESFEGLAKQYSDDKNSAKNGGKLNRFGKGDLKSPEFEEAAYSLNKAGEYSKPIQSSFGWHIIRLDEKHDIATFDEKKTMLEKRVAEGSRSKIVTHAVNDLIKKKFGFKKGADYHSYFDLLVGDEVLSRRWKLDTIPPEDNKTLFTIADKSLDFRSFAEFIEERQVTTRMPKIKSRFLAEMYDEFETQELKRYFKDQLEAEDETYAAVISEYRDGLLIFDVMDSNIWRKVRKDTTGQKQYYEQNKESYKWKERIGGQIYAATSLETAKQVSTMLNESKSADEIKKAINLDNKIGVIVTSGMFEIDARDLPEGFVAEEGVSKIYEQGDSFLVVRVSDVTPPKIKRFEEIKGRVMSDYQNEVEANWMKELRKKFDVEINKKTLKKVKKELKA